MPNIRRIDGFAWTILGVEWELDPVTLARTGGFRRVQYYRCAGDKYCYTRPPPSKRCACEFRQPPKSF